MKFNIYIDEEAFEELKAVSYASLVFIIGNSSPCLLNTIYISCGLKHRLSTIQENMAEI